MTGRHVLLLVAAAAVALCAVFVIRALDGGDAGEVVGPAESATPPEPAVVRAEPAAAPASTRPRPGTSSVEEPVPPADSPSGLEAAEAATERLARLLKDRTAPDEDLLDALAAVQRFYLHPPPPPGLVLHAPPANGPGDVRRVVLEANLRLLAEEQRWPAGYVNEILAWRRRAEKLFLEALKLQQVDSEHEVTVNVREDVNVRAAQVLASTGNPDLSRDVTRALETSIFKAGYEVSQALLDETFGALGALGHPDALEWMRKEFTHAKSSPKSSVDRLSAAHKAMLRFDRDLVDGAQRLGLVQEMIKSYAGVETMAGKGGDGTQAVAARAFWERIGEDAVRVVQYYASDPLDDDEEPLATMDGFKDWFRRHKNPQKPPWRRE